MHTLSPGFSLGRTNHSINRALAHNFSNMAYVRNWLHCVWGTKSRIPFLQNGIKKVVLDHIKENAKLKGIYIDIINGHSQHLHCLISLHPDQALSDVIRLMKGESSFWINKNHITKHKFSWAVEYFAVSVSDSHVPRVRNYIRNQEDHHRKKTWKEEYDDYISKYGFERFPG
jgi:putative transposase